MKKIALFIFLFVGFQYVKAQESDSTFNANEVYIQKAPKFVGGQDSLFSYIKRRAKCLKSDLDTNIQSRVVYVGFIISDSGRISEAKILNGIQGAPKLDSLALQIIKNMPDWIPGQQDGKNVPVQYALPIKFTVIDEIVKNNFSQQKAPIVKRPFSPTKLAFAVVFFLLLILLFLQMFHRWRHK